MLRGLGKVHETTACLHLQHLSPKVGGKVYTACVQLAMLQGNETRGPYILDLKQLCSNDRAMICWICGTNDQVETSLVSLLQKLGIKDITAVLHSGWLG